ncbi:response regulator [Candidatus Woesearchaeota archaeon]|nr:response regulator [Candidatus Woesearchaeota archaeon]
MAKFKPTMEMPHAKILIVDDSSFTRELVSKMLVQAGFSKPLEAESAGSALGAVKANKPDLLILDIDLGGELDGVDVLRAVKRDTPAVKVIVLSALSQRLLEEKLMEEQADAFIVKPFRQEQLLFAVGLALGYDVM